MPALSDDEALAIAGMIGVKESVVLDNLKYMKGITRYLFEPGSAKRKVVIAVETVNATSITKMVSVQASDKIGHLVAVHSLVLWTVNGTNYEGTPRFELVSHYAEDLVARKLVSESVERLKRARQDMAPLSGAEGYAGALFEAYAIRTLQAGGDFVMRSLDGAKPNFTISIPQIQTVPIVAVEGNKLTASLVPYGNVRVLVFPPPAMAHYDQLSNV